MKIALLAFALALPAPARAHVAAVPHAHSFDGVDLFGEAPALVPRLQVDPVAIFDFIPRGGKGDAEWEWPLVISGLIASAAIATGASVLTTMTAVGCPWGPQGCQIGWGLIQLGIVPPLVALATWGIQAFSYDFDSNYYMPLLFSFAGELVLIAARIAAVFLVPQGGQGSNDLLGPLKYADWALHFLLIPVIAEFITLHQRDVKGGAPTVRAPSPPADPVAQVRDPLAPAVALPAVGGPALTFAF
jgi:hypothetical protein